jgi:hypothetical protein
MMRFLKKWGLIVVIALAAVKFSQTIKDAAKNIPVVGTFLNS